MSHYLDRFVNCKITVDKIIKDPASGGAFGSDEIGPATLYQDLSCYLSKKNMTESYIASKYIGTDVYQILIKRSLLPFEDGSTETDLAKRIDAANTEILVTAYRTDRNAEYSTDHNFVGRYRIVGFDPERGRNARRNLHAKLFMTRIKDIDDIDESEE